MSVELNCEEVFDSKSFMDDSSAVITIEDSPPYIKSESECESLLTTEVNIKEDAEECTYMLPSVTGQPEPIIQALLRCPYCFYSTKSTEVLEEHLRNHNITGFRQIVCKECSTMGFGKCPVHRYETPQPLPPKRIPKKRSSTSKIHVKRGLQCKDCNFLAASIFKLNKHSLIHSKPSVCSNCFYQPTDIYDLEQHLRLHAIQEPLVCKECSFETPWKREFEEHLITHTQPERKLYKCSNCFYETHSRKKLRHHLHRTCVKLYSCDKCSYKCRKYNRICKHMYKHELHCPKCPYSTFFKQNMLRHVLYHELKDLTKLAEYAFRCHLCQFKTDSELIFEMHLKEHRKPRQSFVKQTTKQKCKFCHILLTNSSSLKAHKCKAIPKTNYLCKRCKYTTPTKKLLQKHHFHAHQLKNIRTSARPFVCPKCNVSIQLKLHYSHHLTLHSSKI